MSADLDELLDEQPTDHPAHAAPPPDRRWRRGLRRLGLVVLVLSVTGGAMGLVSGYLIGVHLNGNIKRIDGAFSGLSPDNRPAARPATSGQTILAVGVDACESDQTTCSSLVNPRGPSERSDTIMLVRFDPRARSAAVVSIPRDTWTQIPGHGMSKINAAYALGGPALLIQTVEQLTNVRIDHFIAIDLAGFSAIVDALHGIDVTVTAATTDLGGHHFRQGTNHLAGVQALAYVRQRYGLPRGDLDRVRRQQSFLRAVFTKVVRTDPADNPVQTYRLLDAMTRAVAVDGTYTDAELRSLALDAVRLRGGALWFLTAAVAGLGREDGQSVVYLDRTRDAALWQAFRDNTVAGYAAAHPTDLLAASTP